MTINLVFDFDEGEKAYSIEVDDTTMEKLERYCEITGQTIEQVFIDCVSRDLERKGF